MRAYDLRHVVEHGFGGARKALFRWRRYGAAPAALVEAVALNTMRGEGGKEGVIGIDVVGKAVDQEEESFGGSGWLAGCQMCKASRDVAVLGMLVERHDR